MEGDFRINKLTNRVKKAILLAQNFRDERLLSEIKDVIVLGGVVIAQSNNNPKSIRVTFDKGTIQ